MATEYEKTEKRLGEYLISLRRIRALEDKIAETRQRLIPASIDYSKTRVMSSINDKMADIVAVIDLYENDLEREIEIADKLKSKIYHEIVRAFPDQNIPCRKVLILKYLKGRKVSDISECLNITSRHVYRLTKQAISTLAEIENKSTEN